jgi:bacterioferritin-associated ferredoxin
VNSSTIAAAIDAGATSVQAVGDACGAGTLCGKCKRNIAILLERAPAHPTDNSD